MAAANTDKFRKVASNTGWQVGGGGVSDAIVTTVPLSSATNLPTDTGVTITIDRVDSSGTKTPAKMERITGVVNGTNVINCVRGVEGTAQSHSAGAVVEILISAANYNDILAGILVEHGQDGKHLNALVTTLKAAGSDIDAGTNDLEIVTPKAIHDSTILYTSFIQRQAIINGGMEVSQENGTATVALANNIAKYACDLISVIPSGTAVSAGTQAQISNSTIGASGYALKLAGVTITGAGTIKKRYRVEAADAVKYKNKSASFSMLELQDTGGSLNYTIQINKANSADNFSAVTQIAISGNLAVPSATGTLIKLENVSMGDCSNGIEIVVTIPCGAITTKNFETTEWQMNVGSVVLPFVCGTRAEEAAKAMRYYERCVTGNMAVWAGNSNSGNTYYSITSYNVQKRTTPTVTFGFVTANGFAAVVCTIHTNGLGGFTAQQVSNAITNGALFMDTWVSDARFTA